MRKIRFDTTLNVRMSSEMLTAIEEEASKKNQIATEYVRELLNNTLNINKGDK